jgi:serine/threonine-protein kinase
MLNNRYIIVQTIGRGGMSAVYQATDTLQRGNVWAIKEMSESMATSHEDRDYAVSQFLQEAQLLRTLNHPNMPKVVDVFAQAGKHYLVMEYVKGQTLEHLLANRAQPLSEAEVVPWAIQLCEVLGYLHRQNIIFRDLKPGNIMITHDEQVKLIDFGIVRFFKTGKARDTQALGTMGYASPEATSGQTDARSDIYSLCVTLHELLTLHDPTNTPLGIPPARRINPSVSPQMESILAKGMQIDRNQRWSSIHEMGAALQRLYTPVSPTSTATYPQPGSVPLPPRTSRPTTRLIEAAQKLTPAQLAGGLGVLLLGTIILLWVLTPILVQMPVLWNSIPLIALIAPVAFAAVPRRGIAFIAHTTLALAGGLTVWARLESGMGMLGNLILGAVLSGVFIEVWLSFLDKIKSSATSDPWQREMGWMALMQVVSTALLYGLAFEMSRMFDVLLWLGAAAVACVGWFVGDLVRQYLKQRLTGQRP